MDDIVLDLTGCVIEHKRQLNDRQKQSIFGELLDYLLETRQDDRWGEWMIALSREQNRELFKKIRKNRGKNCMFDCVREDADGYDKGGYDKRKLAKLDKEKFNDFAFFVRRINMRINQLRGQNYRAYEKVKGHISSSAQKKLREELKIFLRNSFSVALLYIVPFCQAVDEIANPNKWYFLLCASRLFYDWARWNYYSVIDDDKKASCSMYRHIRNLAIKCAQDQASANSIKCRFNYLAATACRYMAECLSEGIWAGETIDEYFDVPSVRGGDRDNVPSNGGHVLPRVYVEDAVYFAKKALDDWEKGKGCNESEGERKALAYRFRRNYARILTFAARWWLLHPDVRGDRAYLFEYAKKSGLREKLIGPVCNNPMGTGLGYNPDGMQLMAKANYFCSQSICAPVNKEKQTGATISLRGKRLLEYEFHLRVFIEMLAWFFTQEHTGNMQDMALESPCDGNRRKGRDATRPQGKILEKDTQLAMSVFCRMIIIYAHLFLDLPQGNQVGTAMLPATADAARSWLENYDFYKGGDESPFDIASLGKTRQGEPPALDETRFEIICSFMFGMAAQNRTTKSHLWVRLNALEDDKAPCVRSSLMVQTFLEKVWLPAKKALATDLRDSLAKVRNRIAAFLETYEKPEERSANYKEYPPFAMHFDLVAAPGNNSKHVEAIMNHHDLAWDFFGNRPVAPKKKKSAEFDGDGNEELERKFNLKTADKEGRRQIVDALFGEGLKREDLIRILFPEASDLNSRDAPSTQTSAESANPRGRNQKTSSLTQFFNNGKSATEIQKAIETLLSVDPMAGVANLSAYEEDSKGEDEYKMELKVFLDNAMRHLAKHSASIDCVKIRNALSVIASLSGEVARYGRERNWTRGVVRTLWNGIVAYIGSCQRLPFSFMSEIGEAVGEAMSASRYFCEKEIESLQKVLVLKSAVLWQHALRSPRGASDSFKIYGQIMGEDMLDASAIRAFCQSFSTEKN